jgi:hypothetical protein
MVTVDAGLRPGRHRFRLVVVDDSGNRSSPDELVVTVTLPLVPPVRDPLIDRPARPPLPGGPVIRPGGGQTPR